MSEQKSQLKMLQQIREAAEKAAKEIGPWTDCPHCGADKSQQEVRNHSLMWHDGDVYCTACGGFVRYFDAG